VTDVPGSVRVRRGPHPHLVVVVDVREIRQVVLVAVVFGFDRGEFLGCERLQSLALLRRREVVDAPDHATDDSGDLVAVGAEVGILPHQGAHHGSDVGVALVFDRVQERVLFGLALDAFA
jgi:hypothetical protein